MRGNEDMKYNTIPHTDLQVSEYCLGTMTFGEQTPEDEAHKQLDYAIEQGINFVDTAEMYSFPGRAETQGSTERFIGNWLTKTKNRNRIILATKIAGPNRHLDHIRNPLDFSKKSLTEALENSLKRLQTDYVDLYQLHWPERKTNFFGQLNFTIREDQWKDNFAEVLSHLEDFVKEGKVRYVGVSNENPWGLMRFLEESRNGKIRIATLQNAFNLLNRTDQIGLAEILHHEQVGYLAYSPLGFGQLTGKYLNGNKPEGCRHTLFPYQNRYFKPQGYLAAQKYVALAEKHGIKLSDMALAFVRQQPFVTSTILGAKTLDQLQENIDSLHTVLSDEILSEIEAIHTEVPNPAP